MPQAAAVGVLAGIGSVATLGTVATIAFAVGSTLLLGLMARSAHTPLAPHVTPRGLRRNEHNAHTGGSVRTLGPGAARIVFGRRRVQIATSWFGDNETTLRMASALSLGEIESVGGVYSPNHDEFVPTSRGRLRFDTWAGSWDNAPELPAGSTMVRVTRTTSTFTAPADFLDRARAQQAADAIGSDLPVDDETPPEEQNVVDIQNNQRTDYTRTNPEESNSNLGTIGQQAPVGSVAANNQSETAANLPGAISLSESTASTGALSNAAISNDDSISAAASGANVSVEAAAPAHSTAVGIATSRTDAAPVGDSGLATAAGSTALPGLTVPSAPSLPTAPDVVNSLGVALSDLPPSGIAGGVPGIAAVNDVISTSLSNIGGVLGDVSTSSLVAGSYATLIGGALLAVTTPVVGAPAALVVGGVVVGAAAAQSIFNAISEGAADTPFSEGGGYIQARPGDVIVTQIGNRNVEELAAQLARESILADIAAGVLANPDDDDEDDPDDSSGGVEGIDHGDVEPGSGDDDFGGGDVE